MKLIQEIIDLLSSEDEKLTEALIKTKVLLHKLGHKELTEWVNYELNGYPDKENVPSYRIIQAQVLVNATNVAFRATSHPIPLGHLTEEQRQNFEIAKMDQSIAVLEKLTTKDSIRLQAPIPMEANGLLEEGLANGFKIQSAWCEIQAFNVIQILTQVRSRLLDFILEIDGKISGELNNEEIQSQAAEIDTSNIFNNAIFGDNATIMIGDHNVQEVQNSVVKNDLDSLIKYLSNKGISKEDTDELVSAIESDGENVDFENKKPGTKVSKWMKKMLGKAIDTTWKIKIGAAGSLLAAAIAKYYGF